jgi:hypothetical protein
MTWPEINEAIRKGDIVDGKSLVGLLLYQQIKGIK